MLTLWCYQQEFKSRLDSLSVKLHGVDNMLGHQLAVHEMAGLLGVAVTQVSLALVCHALEASQARLLGVCIGVVGPCRVWVFVKSLWLCLKLVPHCIFCSCCVTCTDLGQYSLVKLIRAWHLVSIVCIQNLNLHVLCMLLSWEMA